MRNKRASLFYTTSLLLLCAVGLIAALFLAAIPSGSQNVTVKTKPIVYILIEVFRTIFALSSRVSSTPLPALQQARIATAESLASRER